MLFLSLFMCVLLHIYAIRLPQQQSLEPSNCTCPYPRTTISNKIYGLSTGIANLSLYNKSDGYLAFNVSCQSGSYLSITHADEDVPGHEIAYIFKTQYATAYCQQIDSNDADLIMFVDIPGLYWDRIIDAVDCLGKSLVTLRLLPLLHVALHLRSDAIKSSIFFHFPCIISSQSSCFQL